MPRSAIAIALLAAACAAPGTTATSWPWRAPPARRACGRRRRLQGHPLRRAPVAALRWRAPRRWCPGRASATPPCSGTTACSSPCRATRPRAARRSARTASTSTCGARLHPRRRAAARHGVDPRRWLPQRRLLRGHSRRQRLRPRRHRARQLQLPPGPTRLLRAPRAERRDGGPARQLRAARPARRAPLGAAQHRCVRRRSVAGHRGGRVGWRHLGDAPAHLARGARALPPCRGHVGRGRNFLVGCGA